MRNDFSSIVSTLRRLASSKAVRHVFGAQVHRFTLHPPLQEQDVARFEAEHAVRLPEDYRGFLIHVGNGGAGPGTGLFRLQFVDDYDTDRRWHEGDGFIGILRQPFPHTRAWNDLTGRPVWEDWPSMTAEQEDERMAEVDAWEAENYWNARQVNGAIPLCHLGCALRQWLVITGPEAGHVWNDYRADERGLSPVQSEAADRATFLDWYLRWLESASEHLRSP